MRKSLKVLIIALAVIFGGGAIGFFITGFATAGSLEESFTFYDQDVPSIIEELNLNADIGTLNIKYNKSNTPYNVEINVYMFMTGLFMAGAQYTDFFTPSTEWWQNATTLNFYLKSRPEVWFNPAYWFKSYRINITIILRTDVTYKINANTGTGSIEINIANDVNLTDLSFTSGTGSLVLTASEGATIQGNLNMDTGTGSIFLFSKKTNFSGNFIADAGTGSIVANLTNSIIGGDVPLSAGTGSITFIVYNTQYLDDSLWTFSTGTGGITAVINQHANMGANVTGTMSTGTGSIGITYKDTSALVGASFYGTTGTGSFNRINNLGFTSITFNPFRSLDFPTTFNYDLSLSTGTGSITVNGTSI